MSLLKLSSMLVCTALLACGTGVHAAGAQKITTLAVEGRTNANPSIAAHDQFVAIAWSAATTSSMDVYSATSSDGGKTFGAPVRVNATPGEARVNGELPPRVALVQRKGAVPEVVVVWTAKVGTATRILSARSGDGGRTYGASRIVPGSEGEGSRGWESVAVDARGKVFVLWLDHREAAMPAAMHHQEGASPAAAPMVMPKQDPTERAGLSKLYFSSLDGTGAVQITKSVCYCCKTSLATSGNDVFAVWRHVYPGSQRDIAFSVSRDNGRTFSPPVRVSDDHWQIDGCPENGPAIAIDREKNANVVWVTPADGKDASSLALYYAISRDGRTFSLRVQIPSKGPASHAQIVMSPDGTPIVAWDEIIDGARHVEMARVHVSAGKAAFTSIASPDGAAGQWYPVLATTSSSTIAAWVRQGEKGSAIAVAAVK